MKKRLDLYWFFVVYYSMRKRVKTMISVELKTFKCDVINAFGDGDHPYADDTSVDYFNNDYVLELIEKARPNALNDSVVIKLDELEKSLKREEI